MVTFDKEKNRKNINKHGLELSFGSIVLKDKNLIEALDGRMNYGEERWNALGMVDGKIYAVTYTERSNGQHFISVRLADRREADTYMKSVT